MTDILDQIDDVLTDWHGSKDSMHWTPDAEITLGFDGSRPDDSDALVVTTFDGTHTRLILRDPEAMAQAIRSAAEQFAADFARVAAAVRAAWDQVGPALARVAGYLRGLEPRARYQHQPMPHLARPRPLPIDGHSYRRRTTSRRNRA